MKIKTYQTIKVIISLIIIGLLYYVVAPHTGENLIYLQIIMAVTFLILIISSVEEYSKLFRR
ncbi:hypothetical protein HOJ01_02935 [bacterium]|jgi:hypothetical protein|nr:hypothetical protein [bacterium]MBT6293739.1 hypothetical protein [bacterium]